MELLSTKSLTFQKFKLLLSQTGYVSWDFELISLIVFVFCWVVAMAHAFYLGSKMEARQMMGDGIRKQEIRGQNQDRKG